MLFFPHHFSLPGLKKGSSLDLDELAEISTRKNEVRSEELSLKNFFFLTFYYSEQVVRAP